MSPSAPDEHLLKDELGRGIGMSQAKGDEQQRQIAQLVESLVREHGSRLERLVMKLVHDREIARLILQDTYERVFRRLRSDSAQPVSDPLAYLFAAAGTNARLYWRRQLQAQRLGPEVVVDDETAQRVPDPAAGPEELAILHEAVRRLSDMIDKMPPKQREVFILSVNGFHPQEIARQLDQSESAVRRQLTRAFARCRKRLEQMSMGSGIGILDGPESH
jgi:RNA polymerase sigma factor (sigma-70 family)